MASHIMYVTILSCVALILQFLPPVASADILTREEGEDVMFMFNDSRNILTVTWGIRDGGTNNLKLGLITLKNITGEMKVTTPDNADYTGRVSFVGNLYKGQAWFKITNLNINDTNQYMARIYAQGGTPGKYDYSFIKLIVTKRVLISSPVSLTREVGQEVLLMFNGTAMFEATWGVRDGNTNDLNPRLYRVFNPGGAFPDTKINSTSYAGRVSFVGDLPKGQAWFKITNLNINDTNQYMARIILKNESSYRFTGARLTVILPVIPVTTRPLQTSTREFTASAASSQTTSSPQPTTLQVLQPSPSFPKSQSSSACTCTSIIVVCVSVIIILVLVVVVLLIYIWRLKSNTGKQAGSRIKTSIQDKELKAYENVHPMEETSVTMTTQTTRTSNAEKEIYETINENRDKGKGKAAIAANVKPTRDPSVGIEGDVDPSLPQHYQELQRMAPNPTPVYEPLKQKSFGNKGELTSKVPKTYEQLKQSASGREYQSLKSYKIDSESKV